MKKIVGLFFVMLLLSCSSSKKGITSSKYQILLTEDYGGAAFQFYEFITEPNEFKMLLGDDAIKKYVKTNDINTSNFILVNLGEKKSEGYKVEISNIEELSDKIIVTIKEIEPKRIKIPSDNSTTNPYCIVKINSKKPIEIK
jgi:hypothetical protein